MCAWTPRFGQVAIFAPKIGRVFAEQRLLAIDNMQVRRW